MALPWRGGLTSLFLLAFAIKACFSSTGFENMDSDQQVLMQLDSIDDTHLTSRLFDDAGDAAQIPSSQPSPSRRGSWLGWGAGIYNNHWAGSDAVVNKSNAKLLAQVCTKKYSPGVSAAPFIENGIAYYPTWSGLVVALDYRRCRTIWQTNVTRLILEFRPLNPNQTFLPVLSRTTPAVDGDVLFIGSQAQALLMALDKRTGRLVDAVQVDEHPSAVLTQSPTVYKGLILIGVSSLEEATASIVPDYECCTFVGSMNAFVLRYGRLRRIWKTAMIPTGSELSGVAVWGGQPSIDPIRNQVFIGSGNMYSLTEPFEECHDATVNLTVVGDGQVGAQCLPKGVMLDSVVALDIPTGRINWVKRLGPLDPWNTACVPDLIAPGSGGGPQCNFTAGPDVDLGMAPTFILGSAHTPDGLDMLVVGQKSSALWGLSAQTGKVLWMTSTGPTGLEGGLIWGVAADDRQVYYTVVNWNRVNYTLPAGDGKTVISNSAFGAASLKDGKIAWQIASPRNTTSIVVPAVVNDVLLTGISGNFTEGGPLGAGVGPGSFLALDKKTGSILREWHLDAYFHGVMSAVHDYVMFGTGYAGLEAPQNGTFQVWQLPSTASTCHVQSLMEGGHTSADIEPAMCTAGGSF